MLVAASTILSDGGTLYMWYTGLDTTYSGAIGLATSTDGISWNKSVTNPFPLTDGEASILKVGPTDYRMYYSNWADGDIYLATSNDGLNWTPGLTSVFSGTHQSGDWDMDWVCDPNVYFDGISYFMFYEGGINDPFLSQIGLATSSDGLIWTRFQADPVLSPGDPGEWDEQWVLDPMVIVDGTDWKMWYRGVGTDNSQAIGYATSTDGATWIKHAGNPVLTADPNSWDDGGAGGQWVMYDGVTYQMWYDSNHQIGYATSDDGINWVRPLDHPVLKPSPRLYFEVNYAHDWAYISTTPNEPVTVTLRDGDGNLKGTVTGKSNNWGEFWSGDWSWDPGFQDFKAFDNVYVEAVGLSDQVEPIGEIQAVIDIDADTVVGSLNAPWLVTATMRCELWSDPWVNIELGEVQGDGGTFLCDYAAEGVDLKPGMQIAVIYFEPDGDKVINIIEPPWMRVNYGHDWVGGNYPAGHTFNITLYDGMGEVKATAEIQSESGKGWGGDGFETQGWQWTPQNPDIQPYEKVMFQSDDGFNDTVVVGDIQGTLDIDLDLINGPVYADWYTDDLNIECHPWDGPPGTPGKNSIAGPDGDPPYTCDWGSASEWDILPGQDVAVMYIDPYTADRVINVFREPAPNMSINQWPEGSGQVLPGGPVIFNIEYHNDGEASMTSPSVSPTPCQPAPPT
jgi:predicted GH43/DUF377 family glycosyl hydrolase